MSKKQSSCASCSELLGRFDRLEKRLDRAEEDAAHWKRRWSGVDEENRGLRGQISLLQNEVSELKVVIEKKDAQLTHLQQLAFGDKSEASPAETTEALVDEAAIGQKRNRGKQPGTKGYGRKIRKALPVEIVEHDASDGDKRCPKCGKERCLSEFSEDSEEITYEYRLVRLRHKRKKYKKTCRCAGVPEFTTAPVPPKLIPKGLFTTDFWAFVILEKFLLQRPLSRICLSLKLQGLEVSTGTITKGLRRLTKLFAPLYNSIRSQLRASTHWQMDETHWRVFVDEVGKENHKWWLWIAQTKTVALFVLDPSRSSEVPTRLLKDVPAGILSCDRYSAYQPLTDQGIMLAYCWAHLRRDFLNLRNGYPKHAPLAQSWIERIDDVFHLNKQRVSSIGSENFAALDAKLRQQIQDMKRKADRCAKQTKLGEEVLAVFRSLQKHWHGLTIFVQFPHVPMDNNASERGLRNAVVGRKIYYGSRSVWSGHLSAMLFSIFETLKKHDVDPRQFLREYLTACALNGGQPPADLEPFLPWKNHQHESLAPPTPTVQ